MFEVKLLESLTALGSFAFVLFQLQRIETKGYENNRKIEKEIDTLYNRIYKLEK